jgi:hypothetical protein
MSHASPQPESQSKRLAVPFRNRINLFMTRIHMLYTSLSSLWSSYKPYVTRVLFSNWKVPIMALIVFVMLLEVLWSLRGFIVFLFGIFLVLMVRKGS